ncbi:MAG TPA: MTH1187 family thiamine-binding protein [Candidatus Methanoperedenaceae archaeon]|nr:MTH1187 family thiamine-binding protein [Candidatus Methanoperedenaceae archaeon]
MKQVVTASLEVLALGTGSTSMSRFVCEAVKAVRDKGLKYRITPMGTAIEASSVDAVFEAAKAAHEAVISTGAMRVVTHLTIDDRRDRPGTMDEKVRSVESKLR